MVLGTGKISKYTIDQWVYLGKLEIVVGIV